MPMTGMRERTRGETGTTMVELIVTMSILVVFFAVFTSVAIKVFASTSAQQARSLNTDSNRNVAQVLDRQVRYANAVNTPVAYAGSQYVEWRAGSTGGRQTCWQWRVTTIGLMQYRSWKLPFAVGDPAAGATVTAWSTAGNGVDVAPPDPIFSVTASVAAAGALARQQLTVSFATRHGSPAVATPTRLALTALNTRTSSAPATPVCQEVART